MRKQVGIFVAGCLYYSGLVGVSRWLMQRSGKKLIILNYHRASRGDLRCHMLYLRRHYRMLHLEEALEELFSSSINTGCDRRTPLVLTFDDGYHDNYTHAFALACELHVPITIFLIPGYVETGAYFWWGEPRRLLRRAQVNEIVIEGKTYHLNLSDEQGDLGRLIDKRLRYASSVVEREQFLGWIREKLLILPRDVALEEEGDRPLTWAEIREMRESEWVSFGAHTMHHPILAYLADPIELECEVRECRDVLSYVLGLDIRVFAYPVGRTEHIGSNVVETVRTAGYHWAVTTLHGVNTPASNPYLLGRVLGDTSRHWLVMAAETSGIWHLLSPLWQLIIGKGETVERTPILSQKGVEHDT